MWDMENNSGLRPNACQVRQGEILHLQPVQISTWRYYPIICFEEMSKPMTNITQANQ